MILSLVDKEGSAIWRLAKDTQKELWWLDIRVCALHPKRPSQEEIEEIRKLKPELLDVQYWKSGRKLFELLPEFLEIPAILSHHNPYDLLEEDWSHYKKVVVSNQTMKRVLPNAEVVTLGIDVDKFKWNREYTDEKSVNMVSGRIESKKGVLEVAKACYELGYTFYLSGKISDINYFNEILKYKPQFAHNCTDEELVEIYHKSALHVCNSIDGFESGTLPILEAISCGVPVLSRKVGYVPDLNNDGVMIRDGQPDDPELKEIIGALIEDKSIRMQMRDKAWDIIKEKNSFRRAIKLYKLWRDVLYDEADFVSVVIPTFNREESLLKVLDGYENQTYKNFEVIVVNDGGEIPSIEDKYSFPIKYLDTGYQGYGLAKARNMGIMNADGKYILFNDDRWLPDDNLIQEFICKIKNKHFLCANRGNNKKTFCEGISFISKKDIVEAGMFNEEINEYGGMSQEIRTRLSRQGIKCEYLDSAKVSILFDSKSRYKKKDQIFRMKNKLWRIGL